MGNHRVIGQAIGLEVPSSQVVLVVAGAAWTCSDDTPIDAPLLRALRERTAREPCHTTLPPLQRPVGAVSGVRWHPDGCGKWIPAEYRICVADAANALPAEPRNVAVFARDGSFYAQALEDAGLVAGGGCRQVAFFHFQEWKKVWAKDAEAFGGGGQAIAPLRAEQLLSPPPFRVSTSGISLLATSASAPTEPVATPTRGGSQYGWGG